MRASVSTVVSSLLFLTFGAALHAQTTEGGVIGNPQGVIQYPPPRVPTAVSLSVSTSGYQFTAGQPSASQAAKNTRAPTGSTGSIGSGTTTPPAAAAGFNAQVALRNNTEQGIAFTFPSSVVVHFIFRVYNSQGVLVYDSSGGDTGPAGSSSDTLPPHQSWQGSQFIPLPSPSGSSEVFKLTVTLNGTPDFDASTSFIVSSPSF